MLRAANELCVRNNESKVMLRAANELGGLLPRSCQMSVLWKEDGRRMMLRAANGLNEPLFEFYRRRKQGNVEGCK